MGKTVAITNQKGGVGKTTTCVNLCCALHRLGKRVLLCDTDPQGNATTSMGIKKQNASPGLYGALVGRTTAAAAVIETAYGDVLPSNAELAGAGIELVYMPDREFRLRDALAPIKDRYDYIFIDCPPSLELLTVGALAAADTVLIPVQCEYFALEGLSDLMRTVKLMRRGLNPALGIEGVVMTMFDGRTNLSAQVTAVVKKHFGDKVYKTAVPRNIRLSEAPSHGKPVMAYDFSSRGSRAYMELAEEFEKRNRGGAQNGI